MKMGKYFLAICGLLFLQLTSYGQQKDSIPIRDTTPAFIKGRLSVPVQPKPQPTDSPYKTDSVTRKKHNPRKATLYSTFLPGLGQIYNRKYWKVPLVAAALGIPAYTYFYNRSEYKKTQFAITVIATFFDTAALGTIPAIPQAVLNKVDPALRTFVVNGYDNQLRSYRNQVRQDQDYSVLIFLLFWGLQIVDATVDAHLKDFDVSDQLSLRLQPADGSVSKTMGLSLVMDIHQARPKPLISLP
jgi:type II secretory pathway pseudopilin PulG